MAQPVSFIKQIQRAESQVPDATLDVTLSPQVTSRPTIIAAWRGNNAYAFFRGTAAVDAGSGPFTVLHLVRAATTGIAWASWQLIEWDPNV